MADFFQLVDLIREHGLDALPQASKDSIDVQARHFARAVRAYAEASAEAFGKSDLSLSDEAAERYELAVKLYAPALVQALAGALLEASAGSARRG